MTSAEQHDTSRTSGGAGGRRRSGILNESLTKRSNLYEVLGLNKEASEDDIKRAYRRLALKYHPDKNRNDEECNKKFQEINFANSILSNPSKRRIYDQYGDMGLKMVDQLGEERINLILKPWVKWVVCSLFVITCGCFGCCCCCCFCFQCCFNFCCGKCKPKDMEEGENPFTESNIRNDMEGAPISSQPQATESNPQYTSSTTSHFTIVCETERPPQSAPGSFEPPPPYSPPNPTSPLATAQYHQATANYGSTSIP